MATPRSVKANIGPNPRVISDDIWAKLQWAGLNLTKADLPTGIHETPLYPFEMVRAMAIVWLFCGLRRDEFRRLRCGCIRLVAQPASSHDGDGEVTTQKVCWLDVPTNKTGSAFTKPVDAVVGEAIQSWESIRPEQPAAIDPKTGEIVHYLFCYRGHRMGSGYLNEVLIPMLCRKSGVPEADARGAITSHRARATITSQLYNAREPMTVLDLKEWLGHRHLSSTEYYVKTSPTRLAQAYGQADYFERNRRMIDVLIDQEAIRNGLVSEGTNWKYYDLGHGYCTYDFYDKCPHRMACARCDFYLPKESSKAQLLEGQANLLRWFLPSRLQHHHMSYLLNQEAPMKQLTITLSILLVATITLGWRLTSTTTRKHRYEGMQLEVNDLSDVGVVVHSPASKGFNHKLSSLLTVPGELAGDAAKYSVILENKTPQHINAIAVIWRFYPSQGKPNEEGCRSRRPSSLPHPLR